MGGTTDPYAAFRLNLEQQKKRAKDLLHGVRAGDPEAVARLRRATDGGEGPDPSALTLTRAQFAIARELGFASWPKLRAHITALGAARSAIEAHHGAPDRKRRTLHIRCGSDILNELTAAAFAGDFLVIADPYCQGPVSTAPNWLEQRARFLAGGVGDERLAVEEVLAGLTEAEHRLAASADSYERVVIWMEHDSHDQLILARCLAHYARTQAPPVLELVVASHFPGSTRFIGLGQLPAEALLLLWSRRRTLGRPALDVGHDAWQALASPDPRPLAAIARSGTPALPELAPALRRHLGELPSVANGLSLTQSLTLQMLEDANGPASLNRLWHWLMTEREPLPFLGDTGYLRIVDDMGRGDPPVFERTRLSAERPFRDELTITATGRAVLRGDIDWLSLNPPPRWVGGVHLLPGEPGWRWSADIGEVQFGI